MPLRGELRPYRELAAYALDAWSLGQHPAIVAAEQKLEWMIANPGSIPGKYAAHWRRLHHEGATGREMLLNILSVYGLRYVGHPRSIADDAVFFACVGSRFLRTVPVGWKTSVSGKEEQIRLPGLTCEMVGRALAEKIGALAILFWRRVEEERAKGELQSFSLSEVLGRHPL